MKHIISAVSIALAILVPAPAAAWNGRGHMAVAGVAWEHMTPVARQRATILIRLNPNYAKWVSGITEADKDRIAFMKAATWPDENRSDPSYVDDGYEPDSPTASQNVGYVDKLLHRYWHFKDFPFSPDGSQTEEPFSPNAVTQIMAFSQALGSADASDDVQSYDLAWLLHLVGDIHQPLHATSRFTRATRKGDNGGNSVMVCLERARRCDAQHSGKLHSFWDGAVGSTDSPPSVTAFIRRLPKSAMPDLERTNPNDWAEESFRIAQRVAYSAPIGTAKGPYRLDREYRIVAGSVAERRIALAGERLAKLLNTRFGP